MCVSFLSLVRPFTPNSCSAAWLTSWPREGKSSTSFGGSYVLQLGSHASFYELPAFGRAHFYPLITHRNSVASAHRQEPTKAHEAHHQTCSVYYWQILPIIIFWRSFLLCNNFDSLITILIIIALFCTQNRFLFYSFFFHLFNSFMKNNNFLSSKISDFFFMTPLF